MIFKILIDLSLRPVFVLFFVFSVTKRFLADISEVDVLRGPIT